ncbi:alpha-1,2-fucosyltransferase [Ectobacillus antri]|uniref:alpha-1,2-fucosyltransferase n=1 Tax=Ectobacillus antri TaxID=2486280 RepID=UPI000F59B7C6|nr:alpha-1,2-fucosyltransferase [Ectobacillus antri]
MKIVHISSGLGNQMFQYALYKKLSLIQDNVFLDTITSYQLYPNQHNGYELEKVFTIKPRHASKELTYNLSDLDNSVTSRIRRKLIGSKKSMYIEHKEFEYDPNLFYQENIYIKGYWQNYDYFKDIENELKNDFTFQRALDEKNNNLAIKINNENSISIHVRRGDYYLNRKNQEKFGDIANLEYYSKAISYIKERIDNPKFYIFSDNVEWVKQNLNSLEEAVYIDYNVGNDSYKDMQLMSLCKHNIIANSSFSWWGAFLNKNMEKIVIAPGKWINMKGVKKVNLFPKDWIIY